MAMEAQSRAIALNRCLSVGGRPDVAARALREEPGRLRTGRRIPTRTFEIGAAALNDARGLNIYDAYMTQAPDNPDCGYVEATMWMKSCGATPQMGQGSLSTKLRRSAHRVRACEEQVYGPGEA